MDKVKFKFVISKIFDTGRFWMCVQVLNKLDIGGWYDIVTTWYLPFPVAIYGETLNQRNNLSFFFTLNCLSVYVSYISGTQWNILNYTVQNLKKMN